MVVRGSTRWSALAVPVAAAFAATAVLFGLGLSSGGTDRRAGESAEARAAALAAHALAPGSVLPCLLGESGEAIANACEKRLFAAPETVAQAVAYVESQLAVLTVAGRAGVGGDAAGPGAPAGGYSVAGRAGVGGDAPLVAALRRQLAGDRYGLAAHVLVARYGCQEAVCAAFALFDDTGAIRANMASNRFSALVGRHSSAWAAGLVQPPGVANPTVPDLSSFGIPARPQPPENQAAAPAQPEMEPAATSAVPDVDFPSADSIPPVSIMDAEPPVSRGEPKGQPKNSPNNPAGQPGSAGQAGGPVAAPPTPPVRRPAPPPRRAEPPWDGNGAKPLPLVPPGR